MARSPSTRLTGLDTLRAVAIVWVMLFHLQSQLPPAFEVIGQYGWIGVDLFFVLSGYLIGSQLLKPYALGSKPSLVAFYRRRVFRILPAYLVVLLLYYAWPTWREQPGISPPWEFLTFTLNYCIDYAHNQAFSQAWSLCVEEHFYLLLPLLLVVIMRKPSFGETLAAFVLLFGAGMAVRAYVLYQGLHLAGGMSPLMYLERLYYPTHARLDGLLIGVALAVVRAFRPECWAALSRRGHTTATAGMLLLGFNLWLSHDRIDLSTAIPRWNAVFGPPLLSLALGLLTASAISRNGWLSRIRIPGAETVALVSFSLYLTHKEMAHLAHVYLPRLTADRDLRTAAIDAACCLSGATILYLGIERPFVRLREWIEGRTPATAEVEQAMRIDPAL
jgi:peptidoglycan/LPS O-acetylase OafA/YrhL